MVNTRSRDFHVLVYNIKYISKNPTHDFFKLLLVLKQEVCHLWRNSVCFKGYNDVPRPQSQPIRPESLIEREETLILPCLHHSVQCSFVYGVSWQNSLVHHTGPDHIYRVGGQRPRQATCETWTAHTYTHTHIKNLNGSL